MNAVFTRMVVAALSTVGVVSCTTLGKPNVEPTLRERDWVSHDGKVMPWKVWPVPSAERTHAVLITVHGLSGATSDFWPLGEALPKSGVAVYGYELRGQGNDPELASRGHVASRRQWLNDLMTFDRLVRARHPGVPVFWHGTSLGSLIVLHGAVESETPPQGLILDAPVAGLRKTPGGLLRSALTVASAIFPRKRLRLGQLAGVDESEIQVTSDTTHGGQMAQTPHHVEAFSVRLLTEIGRLLDGNEKAAYKWKSPVLVLASPMDVVASKEQIGLLFQRLSSEDKTLIWFDQSRHLLLHDVEREDVLKAEAGWITGRIGD